MSYIHDHKPESNSDEFFGEVIDSYTDEDALEDGTLIAYPGPGGINRVTRAVFTHFTREMGPGITDITALEKAMKYILTVEVDGGWRTGNYQGKALWLLPNEVRGFTLMFPEDY
jgi:hypothetical protein